MLDALNYRSVAGRSADGLENYLFGVYLITRGHNHSKTNLSNLQNHCRFIVSITIHNNLAKSCTCSEYFVVILKNSFDVRC